MAKLDLTDKVICITGASAGIGRATAIACAKNGMNVVVSARRADRLNDIVKEIEEIGSKSLAVVCDVADDAQVKNLIEETIREYGKMDVILANAGYGWTSPVADFNDEKLRSLFEVNFFGTVRTIREAMPVLRDQGYGHIIITSSCMSRFSLALSGAYAATKAAQTQIARSMRLELQHENIEVSVVHPITTITEFFDVASDISGTQVTGIPDHAPKMFIQTAEHVAKAIVKCIRKPVPEVWTSIIVRLTLGTMVAFPRLSDYIIRKASKPDLEKLKSNQ